MYYNVGLGRGSDINHFTNVNLIDFGVRIVFKLSFYNIRCKQNYMYET